MINDVARPQGRRQHLLDPGEEAFSVHWSVEKHWRDEAGQRQAADKSDDLPMTVWDCGAVRHCAPSREDAPCSLKGHFRR
jgi:hypothetical protein